MTEILDEFIHYNDSCKAPQNEWPSTIQKIYLKKLNIDE